MRCKGTTKIAHTQIFLEKNAFLGQKMAYGLQFATDFGGEERPEWTFDSERLT